MDLLKLLKKYPKDYQALQDANLNISVHRNKDKTWQAVTWSKSGEDATPVEWSRVLGYESPNRAVLHAIRAGVEARMKAVAILSQESKNAAE
jgi:hypothetical protein